MPPPLSFFENSLKDPMNTSFNILQSKFLRLFCYSVVLKKNSTRYISQFQNNMEVDYSKYCFI